MNDKWKGRFCRLALEVASWSKDPSTKVGAVIVNHEHIVYGLGYNGFPRGVSDDAERYSEKMVKYKLVVHAEANAIMNATRSVRHMIMLTTKFPCSDCTKLIIQSGIDHIITPRAAQDGIWAEDAAFSTKMLVEADVVLEFCDPREHMFSFVPMEPI